MAVTESEMVMLANSFFFLRILASCIFLIILFVGLSPVVVSVEDSSEGFE